LEAIEAARATGGGLTGRGMAMSAGRAMLRMGLLFVAAAALTAPVPGQERKVRK
jgi:hypothetical protein